MKHADVEKYLSSVSKNFVGAFEEISQESHAEEFLDLVDRAGDCKTLDDADLGAHEYLRHTNIRGYGMDARWI
eukprot:CAMPEP_0194318046 /NCGR_PEP_ID=MMETSP0171-20130528/14693_1 /TAXON_ID=218684 /ORGANISM="Corethron pennatum, Strain L29A3" /LENGTH=72 /DNA_ID=CAMNT_0039074823 /DNA_START=606 /DNA_END=824 /DNA_ORIENTATION=+